MLLLVGQNVGELEADLLSHADAVDLAPVQHALDRPRRDLPPRSKIVGRQQTFWSLVASHPDDRCRGGAARRGRRDEISGTGPGLQSRNASAAAARASKRTTSPRLLQCGADAVSPGPAASREVSPSGRLVVDATDLDKPVASFESTPVDGQCANPDVRN